MTILFLDDETFSATPITSGTHRYSEGAEILLRAWAIDEAAPQVQDVANGEPAPRELLDALLDPDVEVWAHNSHFDRTLERVAGFDVPRERWRDTMVQAMAHGLPGKLADLCEILKLPQDKAKDAAGKALIQLFCKPPGARMKRGRATRATHPAEWARFKEYAASDINAMREVRRLLPTWNYRDTELALWHLDQQINDRGVCIDVALAQAAVRAVGMAQHELKKEARRLTRGEVESTTQRKVLLGYVLKEYGIMLPNLQAATLERCVVDHDLPMELRELLRVRLSASTTSTSKYRTLLRGVSSDGRMRGLLQFNGASRTGRWAGRLWQPQNLPRPSLKQPVIDAGIDSLLADCAELTHDSVMALTSSAIRGCIIAPPGKKLVVADLANIEGRDQAWLAGEAWKLEAFSDYDAGLGHDLYALAYARSFGVTPESVMRDKETGGSQRQIGKTQELALGYEGGVGAFLTFAAAYNIDLAELARTAIRTIPAEIWGQANIMLKWHRDKGRDPAGDMKMADNTWLMCESLKIAWRQGHPNIARGWKDLDATVRQSIDCPGKTFTWLRVKVRRDGAWLRLVLPSGRALCYPSPSITASGAISYMGVNQYSRKWGRIDTYGGKLFENCIAAGTEVLTLAGWCPIELVGDLPVWDGVEWAEHAGCVYKGKQLVLTAYGVQMTPDHKVLTAEGWKNASSCEGLDRAEVRLPYGYSVRGGREQTPIHVGSAVRVRQDKADGSLGVHQATEARHPGVMRLPAAGEHRSEEHKPRYERPPSLCGMAQHDGSLPVADASGVPELRRAGDQGVHPLGGGVRAVLAGHGADVSARADAGAQGQFAGLLAGELPVAIAPAPGEQHAAINQHRNAHRSHHGVTGSTAVQDRPQHAGVAPGGRVAGADSIEPVYDLMDCGPRHRFVVRGADGLPLIVHNCCQGVARDVMAANMPAIEAAGYQIVLTVHDEVICEAPDEPEFNPKHLSSLLAAVPDWAEGMPLAAAGFEAYRYKKD